MILFKKYWGQHFLRDESVIDRLVSLIDPQEGQFMIEIGPGVGALTCKMLPLIKKMHVIEIDQRLIPSLKRNCANLGELVIHRQNVLTFDFAHLCMFNGSGQKMRIIGNLPYNISTPLLFYLFQTIHLVQDMHFMFQKEVADRITAHAGDSAYGRLSIMAQYYCHAKKLLMIPPDAFVPPPTVYSTFVSLQPRQEFVLSEREVQLLDTVVRCAFTKRRKTLRNALKSFMSEQAWVKLEMDANRRPENLRLEDYLQITHYLANQLNFR